MFPYPLVWPSLEEELAPFLQYCKGIVLNAGSGTRNIKLGGRDFGIDIVADNNPDIIGDLHRIPLLDETVDTVVSIAVLEHTRYPWLVAQEFYRVLRPGGYGVIAVPFLQPQHSCPHDFVRFTGRGLQELMEYVGFEVRETKNVHHFGQTIAWLLWEYLLHNIPEQSTWHFWETLLKELSLGNFLGGDSPNTHNTEYVIVVKPGDTTIKQPYYLEALSKSEQTQWFLPLLSCPKTRQTLHFQGDCLVSEDGQHLYPLQYGKPYLLPTEGEFKLKVNPELNTLQIVSETPATAKPLAASETNGQPLNNHQKPIILPQNIPGSAKSFSLDFTEEMSKLFPQTHPPKIAVLATSEYEGIFKNGGVGTYYKNLGIRLSKQGWYVIVIICDFESNYRGESNFKEAQHIFSTTQVRTSLNLQSIHHSILDRVQHNWFDCLSISCWFFIQAMANHFPNSKIYGEFHEMSGIGYRTLEAKQSNILGDNCVLGVTLHSGHEWVYEANDKYLVDNPELFWQVSGYEQFCFENADLAFYPSHYLTTRVQSYGWETEKGIQMPNYIPQIKLKTKINQDDLNQYRFDDLQLRQEMEKALRETYYNKVDEKLLKTPELNRDIEDHVFQRYHTTLFHYVNWVRKVFNLEGKDIVEIGCGTGSSTAAFAHFCKHIYAYEIVESSLLAAKKRMEIMGINNVDIIAVNPSNSLETIKKNHQDGVGVILLFAVLEHMTIAERLETLRETWNLLAPEGILIVAETPNRLTYYDHHTSWLHFFHMLPEDLAIEYYQKSPRADFKHSINKTIEESKISGGKEKIIRWGNGVSFHEFEIALKSDLDNLIIADGDDEEMRSIYPMTEQEELLRNYFVKQKIEQPLTFTNSVLNFILQKKINIK